MGPRRAWAPAKALVLHLRSSEPGDLPWDYLRQARLVRLSLANLFPRLSYGVVHRLGAEYREALFEAHAKHASQSLGEAATKEFILTHIFQLGPHLIAGNVDLWRELLRLHYRNTPLPTLLADHVQDILEQQASIPGLPISELFASQRDLFAGRTGGLGTLSERQRDRRIRVAEPPSPGYVGDSEGKIEIPFEHPDIRSLIDSMFLDGTLHPLLVQKVPADVPDWLSGRDRSGPGCTAQSGPRRTEASARHPAIGLRRAIADWLTFAKSFGEILSRFHALDQAHAQGLDGMLQEVQQRSDELLVSWMRKHYSDLPSLPVANGAGDAAPSPAFSGLAARCWREKGGVAGVRRAGNGSVGTDPRACHRARTQAGL